jgi:UTP--glucose-1-phosphate uridylyltransferase
MSAEGLQASVEKMRREGVPDAAIATFRHYYEQLAAGESGLIPEDVIEPVRDLTDADALPDEDAPLDEAVVIKLNGGLGTSMGMDRAKSLLEVKHGMAFLDVIARQVLALREKSGARVPLVLMNSFYTRDDSLALLERYDELAADVPFDFVQHKEPKLLVEGLAPAEWPPDPALEWCPPGHGDIYPALLTSGMLELLLERGYRYAFMSNSDNLGAVLDPRILAWIASEQLPYVAEVTERTEADKKGGHLGVLKETGGLILRETAQTPDEDMDAFTDVERHPYFHVNNLWVDLQALEALLRERDGVLGLPMIVNEKTVDPADSSTPAVYQLETAMGAAIEVFTERTSSSGTGDGARAIRVPRSRFVPVKKTSDLLVLRSDAYVLGDGARIELAPGRDTPPVVQLDDDHFKLLGDFDARFPAGAPSLVRAERLEVNGDVTFGRDVAVRGSVTVEGPRRFEAGAELDGTPSAQR